MAFLTIRKYGDPVLRKKAQNVAQIDHETRQVINDMIETLNNAQGVGLAATQVGILKRIMIIDLRKREKNGKLYRFVNPEFVEKKGSVKADEGCLSFPGITAEIKRYAQVRVKALDEKGADVVVEGEGILARALQHEMDHLDGVMIVDRMGVMKKLALQARLNNLKKQQKKDANTISRNA